MTMHSFDDMFDDLPSRSSLRIPSLQDLFPGPSTTSARPSPLEPIARVNIDSDTNKLTGRRAALAQAKPLDAPETDDWETLAPVKLLLRPEAPKIHQSQEASRKKQKLYDHEQIVDFVQLPKPQTKARADKPRPFQPIAVLNELHEPPPSAALFPPITPSARQEKQDDSPFRGRSPKSSRNDGEAPTRRRKVKDHSTSPATAKRTYNRGRTKWTDEETDQLVKGIAIYGVGRWKNILEHSEFHFKKGRTGMDLKDRFRVCFPADAPHKWVRPIPVGPESDDEKSASSPAAKKCSPQKDAHMLSRSRKRHWSEEEDAELDKGFRLYGYQWNLMVKDTNLKFDRRSGGQIRDRFRLRFPELYNQQHSAPQQKKPPPNKKPNQSKKQQPPQAKSAMTTRKSSDLKEQAKNDEGDIEGESRAPPKTALSFTTGLLNAEDEHYKLSNSILRDDWDWDDNLTLAPVAWEDMANKPMFQFD